MKSLFLLSIAIAVIACNNNQGISNNDATKQPGNISTNEPISAIRKEINPKPVASFLKPVEDELNDWHFSVNVYETKETFHYLMKMQYKELEAADTLKIPNIGINPTIEIHEGKDKYSCIVGFLDKENNFKEYKLVSVKDDNLKVTILHRYAVTTSPSN